MAPRVYLGTMTFGWTQASSFVDIPIATAMLRRFALRPDTSQLRVDTARIYSGGDTESAPDQPDLETMTDAADSTDADSAAQLKFKKYDLDGSGAIETEELEVSFLLFAHGANRIMNDHCNSPVLSGRRTRRISSKVSWARLRGPRHSLRRSGAWIPRGLA